MDKDKNRKIEEIINEFFQKMTWEDNLVEDFKIKDNKVSFCVNTDNPEFLIGKNGQVLVSLQYMISKILRRKTGENISVDLDVNNYKKKKIEILTNLAQEAADEVVLTKKEKSLQPMSSFERKIIHLTLSQRDDVSTESRGEEPQRYVVIKPLLS